ncbi:MAG: 4,5-DOPA dioxygenase extradiol [Bacteroidota bacterium]
MNSSIQKPNNPLMPVLFVGHGSPMNAIETNEFSENWRTIAQTLPKPESIVCISAHWQTFGTKITAMPLPKTIHDFGGFPKELFDVQYTAPGNPKLANDICQKLGTFGIEPDMHWGLDHGCWSVVRCMYPQADIPIVQVSLNRNLSGIEHYNLAKEFMFLRKKGILILGSGNIVHNLHLIEWDNESGTAEAISANKKIKDLIRTNNHLALMDYQNLGNEVIKGINSAEHYLPLLYILALKQANEKITFFNDKLMMGWLAMTSVLIQ